MYIYIYNIYIYIYMYIHAEHCGHVTTDHWQARQIRIRLRGIAKMIAHAARSAELKWSYVLISVAPFSRLLHLKREERVFVIALKEKGL